MSKNRNWCFTLNNPTLDETNKIRHLCEDDESIKYVIVGHEFGLEGTPHLQGYIEFKNPRTFNSVKDTLIRCHIESRKGTQEQAINHC